MAFKKGKSGNPKGRPKSDKMMREAIILELKRTETDDKGKLSQRIRLVARKLIAVGLEGDVQAIKEINDRVDGKSPQSQVLTGADGGPVVVQLVKFNG